MEEELAAEWAVLTGGHVVAAYAAEPLTAGQPVYETEPGMVAGVMMPARSAYYGTAASNARCG